MSIHLEQEVADFGTRRAQLADAVRAYGDWLDHLHGVDGERSLRLADLAQSLAVDRLEVAFVAEFSRGKSELINALFFADSGRRLLPSDAGRTTMCPTELYCDADAVPALQLLPIETRRSDESIARLRHKPVEWVRIAYDPDDTRQLQDVLRKLTETKRVAAAEAIDLGLWSPNDADEQHRLHGDGSVDIPAWRYARLNYPHPLLKAGLTVLDTPGLNALGAEPELTLSVIPHAHAVLFVLGTDTGVTRSDLEIWQKHVHRHSNYHIAVLNKIDMLWDELKSDAETHAAVERQLAETARVLKLPQSQIFAVSAQKALVAKIQGNAALRARSGIDALEHFLAHQVVPMRRDIVFHGVRQALAGLMQESRTEIAERIRLASEELIQLTELSGKNRELVGQARAQLQLEKEAYDATADAFRATRAQLTAQGERLLAELAPATLAPMLDATRDALSQSWTTRGLIDGIGALAGRMGERFTQATLLADELLAALRQAYARFHRQHGLPEMDAPRLDLGAYRQRLRSLIAETDAFCRDPANLVLEKRFMIRRFYGGVVAEAEKTFALAAREAERWLRIALDPVVLRIRAHKAQLDTRLANLKTIHENMGTLHARMADLKQNIGALREQRVALEAIAARLGL
jgi:hypothetical protein